MRQYGDKFIWVALSILICTVHGVGITSTPGTGANFTKQAEERTSLSFNSTLQNGSSENCDTFTSTTNSSWTQENIKSKVTDCLQNEPQAPSDRGKKNSTVALYLAVCLGVWSVLANSLPLTAIINQEQLHIPVYILMANLAASDVFTGISFVFSGSTGLYYIHSVVTPSIAMSRLRFTLVLLSGLSSANSLMALTAERYWFIVHGMTYVNNVTNGKCKVVIVIVWVWAALLAILPLFGWHCAGRFEEGCLPIGGGLPYSYVAVVLVLIFIPMAAIVYFNMGIFWCLWKHMNAIADQEAAVGAPPSINRKSAFTIVLITVVFLVGWLPFSVRLAMLTEDPVSLAVMFVFIVLNSAMNPIIYAFRLQEVRRGVVRLFVNSSGNANLAIH